MDSAKFDEAQQLYDAGDFRTAAKVFLASAGRGAEGNGRAYHMAGNALMRLRRYSDAVTVYRHALADEGYGRRGAVHGNLGSAYRSLGDMGKALLEYEAALVEDDYDTPYKAWQGIAAVQMERGRIEEAAGAYRRAALDDSNPEPSKALVNLGLCFMGLDRPRDAIDAYQAALGFEGYRSRGKALANLGQAYTALGEHADAVKAFEKAAGLHGHKLSATAAADFETSKAALGPAPEVVEGWVTGEMPSAVAHEPAEQPQGWGTEDLEALAADEGAMFDLPPAERVSDDAAVAAADLGFGDEEAVSDFFSRSEDEMKVISRETGRAERAAKGGWTRIAIIVGVVVVLLGVLLAVGYNFGFGWPTQNSTVNGLFVAFSKGEAVENYWVAVPDADVEREMAKVPPVKSFSIGEIDREAKVSTVRVIITPQTGADLEYLVTLGREGVGWKVSGIDYQWSSTGG